jgi:hypothetical protein
MANWLYDEVGKITLPDPQLYDKVKAGLLHPSIRAFIENVNRIRAVWALYPHLVETASINVRLLVETVFSLTGRPFLNKEEMDNLKLRQKVTDEANRRITEQVEAGRSIEEAAGYSFARGLAGFGELLRLNPGMDDAISATFSAQVTSAWTAFETLASDLWEAAVNHHPAVLARLEGARNRISKQAGSFKRDKMELGYLPDKEEFEPRLKDFDRVTLGTYDASELMGTLLRENFKFQTLAGLRQAYSKAFPDSGCEEIDLVLADHALDKLNLVRNLLLHKAGIVDDRFLKGADSIPWDILADEEKPLPLNGGDVRDLINPAIQCGEKLVLAVDKWMQSR